MKGVRVEVTEQEFKEILDQNQLTTEKTVESWSCMFMYSHVQLCIAMHGGVRLGCMVIYAQVCSCIVMYSCV